MGYELAHKANKLGANVILVSGPTHLKAANTIQTVNVRSAQEMYDAVHHYYKQAEIIIMAAAVADYTPENKHAQKLKKSDNKNEYHEKANVNGRDTFLLFYRPNFSTMYQR